MNDPALQLAFRPVLTRLQPPLLRADVIYRQRLMDALKAALDSYRFVLVSAPAGYGKTTLLAALSSARSEPSLAWLSLEAEDNDPACFLTALIAALERLNPGCCSAAQHLLGTLDNPASQVHLIVDALINDLLEVMPDPFVLMIDDLHVVTEPTVHDALDRLIERLPSQMSLVVATRREPPLSLTRLRARRQMAELRLADLSFTLEEVERFLNQTLGLGFTPEQIGTLQERTEGWPAGISLLVSSLGLMPTEADRDAFVDHLARTDRYVFDFLAEEVLAAQEPHVSNFLLETSILAELRPALCAAVTGRDDAMSVLEELYRRNLFVVAIDRSGTVYRYHDLFKEFLRKRLLQQMPERVHQLHRRAADAEVDPTRAISHYLAAEAWDEAARAIERVGEHLLQQGSLDTLQGWICALPNEARVAHPRLSYLLGRCAWMRWELGAARTLFERALENFEATGDKSGQIDTLVHLATCLSTMADIRDAAAVTERAFTFPLPPHYRAQVLLASAWVELGQKNWPKANAYLDEVLTLAQEARDIRVLQAIAFDYNSPFTGLPGGVERTERLCRLLSRQVGEHSNPLQIAIHGLTFFVHLWRGRWDAVPEAAQRAFELSERFGGVLYEDFEIGGFLPIYYALRGHHETADYLFDAFVSGSEQPGIEPFIEPWRTGMFYVLGRVRWLQGRLEAARDAYAQMRAAEGTREWPMAPVLREMMQGMLWLSERRYDDAEHSLREAAALQDNVRFSTVFNNAYLLLSHLYLLQGRSEDALATLGPVLAEHEQQGTPGFVRWEGDSIVPVLRLAVERGIYAEFAARVLELFGAADEPRAVEVPESGETLTAREVEVLRLVSSGASNQQIADELVISLYTVKRHVANTMRKLGVSTRTQAAARARGLGVV